MVTVRVQIRISKDGNEVGLTSVHESTEGKNLHPSKYNINHHHHLALMDHRSIAPECLRPTACFQRYLLIIYYQSLFSGFIYLAFFSAVKPGWEQSRDRKLQ